MPAGGDLDVAVPTGRSDELGALFEAMEWVRRSIKASMGREVTMRESAQMQLANALEHSAEGVVVIDASARIALANAQAADLLLSDAERLAAAAVRAGVDVTLHIGEGLPHVYPIMLGTREAAQATEQTGNFLRTRVP